MTLGTKSLLYGAHQFIIHPLFVLVAWVRLYGWPTWRELVCIVIHDWGYWGSPNMDGPEGERHPEWAAKKASKFFDGVVVSPSVYLKGNRYYQLCLFHSRYYAKRWRRLPSTLCFADKLGTAMMPPWLWVTLTGLTGERHEYMNDKKYEIQHGGHHACPYVFFERFRAFVRQLLKAEGL